MSRFARVVIPDTPHHVTQRGNGRARIFFEPGDETTYLRLLAEQTRKAGVDVWAYCLMPNHVHLIAIPRDETGLARAIGETHRRYTSFVNVRAGRTGHLFQGRFASVAMDEDHLLAAARYVCLNPVRARLAEKAEDWAWSSARAHLGDTSDPLVNPRPLADRVGDFAALLATEADDPGFAALRAAETTGRPLGSSQFVEGLERRLGRLLAPQRRGRKARKASEGLEEIG
jgi:putative transposase